MAQLFPRGANSLARATLAGALLFVIVAGAVGYYVYRGPYVNEEKVARAQPVPFSHKHHVQDLGLDCRFCHTSAETSSFAGIPPVKTCMTCHSQIWPDAPVLAPIRESYKTGRPIAWTRVNEVPDFVYFDHSIHVNKGVACVTCHGPVGEMPIMYREHSLEMKWCIECHKNPEKFIGQIAKDYHVKKFTDCYTCHR